MLPRLTPRAAASAVLTSSAFGADVAVSNGLITYAVSPEELGEAVSTTLRELASCEPQGLTATKRLLNADSLRHFDARLDDMVELSSSLFASGAAQRRHERFSR